MMSRANQDSSEETEAEDNGEEKGKAAKLTDAVVNTKRNSD